MLDSTSGRLSDAHRLPHLAVAGVAALFLAASACAPSRAASDGQTATEEPPSVDGRQSSKALQNGLDWLAAHQDEDGKWDADGFMKHDTEAWTTPGPGLAQHDVGVTGLALLAFLGEGNTTKSGPHKQRVLRGAQWLLKQQDPETGQYGTNVSQAHMYDHGIATLAMCEAYYLSDDESLKDSAQSAVNHLVRSRNPYGVWRYDAPPNGDNDTSVTGWMICAMKSAEDAGLKIDRQAYGDASAWLDAVTDVNTGRVGYSSIGERSSRIPGVNEQYPLGETEAMTAVGLLTRFFIGQAPKGQPVMNKHADLILKSLPEWDEERGLTNDLYYWYYGSYAMYQMGGKYWNAWHKSMNQAVIGSQESSGTASGSWSPDGPWGQVGGRVYSTALCVLSLETSFRYAQVVGTR